MSYDMDQSKKKEKIDKKEIDLIDGRCVCKILFVSLTLALKKN